MGIVLDYTYRIAPAALKAAGATGVCRYLKPDSAPAYRIGLAEYRELVDAGIDVTLNWEYDAHDWLGGAARGQAHGAEAVRQARALSYPDGRVIVGSADFDMSRAQWDTSAAAYARAFAATVRAGGFRPGVYGPWDVLGWVRQAGYMDAFWQCMSKSFSQGRNANPWPGAHLLQHGYKTVAGQVCDWNEILIPDWGDDMALNDIVPNSGSSGTGGKDRTVGQILGDLANLRAVLIGEKTAAQAGYGASTPLAQVLTLAAAGPAKPVDLAALAAALAPLLDDRLDAAAVLGVLQSPEGQAALGSAAFAGAQQAERE